jgi:hypothetical protein
MRGEESRERRGEESRERRGEERRGEEERKGETLGLAVQSTEL